VPKSYQQIISIIGSQYGQPIADLIGSLIARPKEPSDRISSNHVEGGYAAAIILLLPRTSNHSCSAIDISM
jgi:hypothetical protein